MTESPFQLSDFRILTKLTNANMGEVLLAQNKKHQGIVVLKQLLKENIREAENGL
jgi:hypothetical protein